jgi:uncharacterized protein with HEPN domain
VSRDPLLLLEDIEKSCDKVVRYTDLNLHIIGEAVKKLPDDLRERYPDVAWREIAGLRDFIAHAYFALDPDILWDAVQNDVPALLDSVREIIRSEKQGEN